MRANVFCKIVPGNICERLVVFIILGWGLARVTAARKYSQDQLRPLDGKAGDSRSI